MTRLLLPNVSIRTVPVDTRTSLFMDGKPLGAFVSIHVPDLVHVRHELLYHGGGSNELHPPSEAQEPAEELFTDINGCRDNEMVFIWLFVNHAIRAEVFNDGIKQPIDTAYLMS